MVRKSYYVVTRKGDFVREILSLAIDDKIDMVTHCGAPNGMISTLSIFTDDSDSKAIVDEIIAKYDIENEDVYSDYGKE